MLCNCPKCEIKENVNSLLRIHLRSSLAFKKISFKHKLSREAFFGFLMKYVFNIAKLLPHREKWLEQ